MFGLRSALWNDLCKREEFFEGLVQTVIASSPSPFSHVPVPEKGPNEMEEGKLNEISFTLLLAARSKRIILRERPILLMPFYVNAIQIIFSCLLYTSPSPRDRQKSRMPSSA